MTLKRNYKYFYISILFILVFFLGSSLIIPEITNETESLIEEIVEGNLRSKGNIITFEFNELNRISTDFEKIFYNAVQMPEKQFKEKLKYTIDLNGDNDVISNSFVCFLNRGSIETIHFSKSSDSEYRNEIRNAVENVKIDKREKFTDTIIKKHNTVYQRKLLIKKRTDQQIVIVGYDINLLDFWSHFSEKYKGDGSYAVVTNTEGVCLLHPEINYIGTTLERLFKTIPICEALEAQNISPQNKSKLIKMKGISEYLGLEVLRYYNTIRIGKSSVVLVVGFPIDIYMEESVGDIKEYFSWISLLAFCTFMLILAVYRFQLKKEFAQNLKIVKEKEYLASANEKYQVENAILQLNQLKKKMNPHFLFNSLNSLHVLIDANPELSQQFVLKLADVYRYLLEERKGNLITVKEELEFLKQYIFLQEIRFSSSLNIKIIYNSNKEYMSKKIPFLSLETLIENAIKHNEITKKKPLFIEIIINEEEIVVVNNYAPRKTKDKNSHHIGLNYLKNNYEYYQVNSFRTEIIDGKFMCFLPLLK